MLFINCAVIVFILVNLNNGQVMQKMHRMRLRFLKNKLQERINQYRERNTEHICYEEVGCFNLPHKKSPLQKMPESPKIINTKFYLFNRNINFSTPEVIFCDDNNESLQKSKFNSSLPLKMVVHGYTSKWNEKGAIAITDAYLKLYNCNIVLVDWQIGARGPQYAVAAANTEVVGRQVGLLLLEMVKKGLDPKNIHLIGFSLGAHVAGSASEILKQNEHLIGRITGLDAASPLFRSSYLREKHKKLDKQDAIFVDVLHTDSSPSVTDGFGLWEPIGHVDFFANGGQQQPGCTDVQESILVSTLERGLTREIACSHVRAFQLFVESVLNKLKSSCQFTTYNCPGGMPSFDRGHCFPQFAKNDSLDLDPIYRNEIGRFGEDSKGEGVMFFNTKGPNEFCGSQLQATVEISQNSNYIRGELFLKLMYLNNIVTFVIRSGPSNVLMTLKINGFGVADYNTLTPKIVDIPAELVYVEELEENANNTITSILYIDNVRVRDMVGNSWYFCKPTTPILDNSGINKLNFILSSKATCIL